MSKVEQCTDAAMQADTSGFEELRHSIEHAAHLLPVQGPIEVFVHHNTLHSFESLSFDDGVQAAGRVYGCHAFLAEADYRKKLMEGRIHVNDIEAALLEDLGDGAECFVGSFGTRYSLRRAMMLFPLRSGTAAELRWVIAETDALRRFRADVEPSVRDRMIAETRRWVVRDLQHTNHSNDDLATRALTDAVNRFSQRPVESWADEQWERFILSFLWRICHLKAGLIDEANVAEEVETAVRHRDSLLQATGQDADDRVNQILIPFCSAFLDQGFAHWVIPDRAKGCYAAFLSLYCVPRSSPTRWFSDLHREACRLSASGMSPLESIDESLTLLGVSPEDQAEYVTHTLLALRGWAGMVRQLETNAEWLPYPAPPGSTLEFLAVRLILDRLSAATIAREWLNFDGPLSEIHAETQRVARDTDSWGRDQRAFQLFQLAQARGWTPQDLQNLDAKQWKTLLAEVDAFSGIERRRIFQHAFERRYRNQTLDAVLAHSKSIASSEREFASQRQKTDATQQDATQPDATQPDKATGPAYQVWCCLDDREESFRRHLEEIEPACETFGIAGFFGVAMYYRATTDAHFKPLCPVNVKPTHYIVEQPLYSFVQSERMRAEARRRIGHAAHQARRNTRTVIGSLLIGALGPLAAIPLVARVLFPRHSARVRKLVSGIMQTSNTELRLERIESDNDANSAQLGYSVQEMAGIVEGALRAVGVCKAEAFAPLVIVCGHGSSSLNNPHEAAYDCGACGGARGGPNARAFAQMANDMRVRRMIHERGIHIPDETTFVGAYHNTCDDSVTWFDLDRIPVRCRSVYERAKRAIDEARKRDAHERCRRFESADLTMTPLEALRHVEGRSEDLSQARPECGHATNACGFVGRREWSRNLFLDRRVFLTSYDPTQDDDKGSILEGMLRAVIPVCAGISLEYYFSYIDPAGYGCGTKLPHNVTSLIGVMDGAASDLRPGLPWQMVEIHEPIRLLFLIETTTAIMRRIIDENEAISKLVEGEWVQLALLDPNSGKILRYTKGEFVPYRPESTQLPVVASSADWYQGHREHLGFASILDHRHDEDRMKGMQTL